MKERFIATSLKKTKINDKEYIYSVEEVIAGDIDEETKILTDSKGTKYAPLSITREESEIKNYYGNIVEADKIEELFEEQYSLREALMAYEKRCKERLFFISIHDEDAVIRIVIDKGDYIKALEQIRKPAETVTNNNEVNETEEDDEEAQYIESLKEIKEHIINGKYNEDELIDIKIRLNDHLEELDSTIQSIDIQLESLSQDLKEKTPKIVQDKEPTTINKTSNKNQSINIVDVFDKVTKTLVAQEEPARRVIVELARLDEMKKKGYGILLTGESGVGKTLFMSLLARHLQRPLLRIDSTQLTAPGFVGRDIEQYLWELYENCNKDIELAQRAIVFFDEIDKKGSEKKSDISGQAVLNTLLTFISGETYTACKTPNRIEENNSIKIDTSNMLIVAGGAFLDVYSKEKKSHSLGFTDEKNTKPETIEPEISDFIEKAQMPKEFMGRVPIIVRMNSLNTDSIRKILLESDESILKMQEEIFGNRGVKLTTQDGYIMSISQAALDRKIGARGLNKLICDTTWKAFDDVCSNPNKYSEIILTEETVRDPSSYQYIKNKK